MRPYRPSNSGGTCNSFLEEIDPVSVDAKSKEDQNRIREILKKG